MHYPVVTHADIGFPLLSRGKVRDIFEIDPETLLLVTTDRMSAFDVVLDDPIPGKGVILNQLTLFWMKRFSHLLPNHIKEVDFNRFPAALLPFRDQLEGRSVLAHLANPLPLECIVRGYLAGSAWTEYRKTGGVGGVKLPAGLKQSAQLPEPLFTPSTKAPVGGHDENITPRQAEKLVGPQMARKIEELSLAIYQEASTYAASRGIIIADTKFEFGMVDGEVTLIDEVLTPDSSRFWPAAGYEPGKEQPSYDKQYLRDWLESQPWDKNPPAPRLPADVAETTARKYREAFEALTGEML